MKFMTILLLVLLSTIQAKGPMYGPLKICLQSLIPEIDAVSPKEHFGVTSWHVIEGRNGNHFYTAKIYTHRYHKYIRNNIEHNLFKALRANAGLDVNGYFLRQPQFFHINCQKYSGYEVNITKYIPGYQTVEETYNQINKDKNRNFWDTFWKKDLAATCQLYDLTKRLYDIHNAGFHHNNVTLDSIGYDENGKLTFNDYGKASKQLIFNKNKLSTFSSKQIQEYKRTGKEPHFGLEAEIYQLAEIAYYLKFGVEYSQGKYFPPYGKVNPPSIDCFLYIFTTDTNYNNLYLDEALNCLKGIIEENNPDACKPTHAQIINLMFKIKRDVALNQLVLIPEKKEHPPQEEDLSQLLPSEFTNNNYLYHQEQSTRNHIDEFEGGMPNISKLINRYGPIQIKKSTKTK